MAKPIHLKDHNIDARIVQRRLALAAVFVVALVVSVAAALRELYVLETPVSHEQLEGIRERLGAAETLHFDNVEALAAGKAAPTGGYNTPGTTAYEYEYASSS